MREFAVSSPFGRIAGLRSGDAGGARVLALHGWLDNAASFVPIAQHLREVDLVAVDLPGHGHSDHLPTAASYGMDGAVHAVLAIADALGWDRFALLGHSMGAGIGSLLAAACPQRITRLVAIEALGPLSEAEDRTAQRLRESVQAARALPGKRLRVFADIDSAIRARKQANTLGDEAARLLVERGLAAVEGGHAWRSDPRLTLPSAWRLTEPQVRDLLAHIECPLAIVFADPAPDFFPEPLRQARAALPARAQLHVLPGSHHLHMEQPGEVAAIVRPFLLGSAMRPAGAGPSP